jgi:mono/diheme cytochrome c family protein
MNPLVLLAIVATLIALRFVRVNSLVWLVAWWVAVLVAVRFGIRPPLPSSIINMFMGIVTLALLTYVFSDSVRMMSATRPIVRFIVDPKYTVPLIAVGLLIPALVAFRVHIGASKEIAAPVTARTIHPAPPSTINFQGKTIDLVAGENPFRHLEADEPEAFQAHVANGRSVYYRNCVFCHGDNLAGDGIFAHALDPIPADLSSPTTIGMLQETYLFWRIAKGAPALPDESTPWASAMPVWEQSLTEEEIWEVILFLYEHADLRPRAREEH